MTQELLDFTGAARYPHAAGHRGVPTSEAAARSVDAEGLRWAVRRALEDGGPMTADECAAAMGLSVLSVRPRFSELKRLGRIAETGQRRPNASGRMAAVWSLLETRWEMAR